MAKYRYVIDNVTPQLCEEIYYVIHKDLHPEDSYPVECRVEIYDEKDDTVHDMWDAEDFYLEGTNYYSSESDMDNYDYDYDSPSDDPW